MKFKLVLKDSHGKKLKEGDIVQIFSNSKRNTSHFFAEVKYLPDEKIIAPFHTFSFHSFKKVKEVPDTAQRANEKRYKVWYEQFDEHVDEDKFKLSGEKYLISWRECEHKINDRVYDIVPIKKKKIKNKNGKRKKKKRNKKHLKKR